MAKNQSKQGKATSGRGDALVTVLMMAAVTAAIAGFGVLFSLWWQARISDPYEILRVASQEYVSGYPIVAGELAETVELEEQTQTENGDDVKPQKLSPELESARTEQQEWVRLRNFLIGAGKAARAAEEIEDERLRRQLFHEAIPYLNDAREAGFPAGRQAEGNRLLGESLFKVGRFDEATEAFSAAIEADPLLAQKLLPMLAEAQLDSLQPTTEQSLATIEQFLHNSTLKIEQRWDGQLIRIRALIKLERWQDAQTVINQTLANDLPSEFDLQNKQAEFRDQVRLLQAILRVRQAVKKYGPSPVDEYDRRSDAVAFLQQTMSDLEDLQREAAPGTASEARLWSARAFLIQGMTDEALTQLTAVRQQRPFGAEAIVGGLEEIELLASQGRGIELLQTTGYVMRELGDAKGFDATLIPFEEFRRRLRDAIDQLRRKHEFECAIDAARSLPPVFARSEALIQEGLGYQEWAESTIADGTDIAGQVARSASNLARKRYRAAGDAFAEAAKLLFDTPQFLPTQWSAIEAYQMGRHFSHSIDLLEPYLRHEQRRDCRVDWSPMAARCWPSATLNRQSTH